MCQLVFNPIMSRLFSASYKYRKMESDQLLPSAIALSKRMKFIILWLFTIFIIAICARALGYYSGQVPLNYDARVIEFFTCNGPPNTPTVSARPINNFATTSQHIYACGRLEGTTFRRFAFYWYRDGKHIYNTLNERIDPGFFYSLLPKNLGDSGYYPGNYRVDIYAGRVKVTSTEFTVR
jgi:hypothetical protein